ncbi:response regulator [Hymenobacter sp. BT491]|uniref:response regulator n=1 Tax=Hymenobacter sp. BT491 TaxID=2766779 RepID=UPI0016534961|nr:response regulator transcription factor [Hymenobacter sp. BT491]MBC6988527.1 response regulator transcription factor [Hymenobacter sp. BT491]
MSDLLPTATGIPVRVLIVDDHPLVIEGVKMLLKQESDIEIVAQAESGLEALQKLKQDPEITVALVDLNMPEMSGVELTQAIREQAPQVRVLVLSMTHDHASVTEVLEAGGSGYVLKNTTREELGEAIRQIVAGRTFFSREVGATLLQNYELASLRLPPREEVPVSLTTREREILKLIAQEYSNYHIAETLFISERTVETHRKNILTKTNSKSVVGLIQYAMRHKLIS